MDCVLAASGDYRIQKAIDDVLTNIGTRLNRFCNWHSYLRPFRTGSCHNLLQLNFRPLRSLYKVTWIPEIRVFLISGQYYKILTKLLFS